MQTFKRIVGIFLFIFAFFILLSGISFFLIPDVDISWGFFYLVFSGFLIWFGILLVRKKREKNTPIDTI